MTAPAKYRLPTDGQIDNLIETLEAAGAGGRVCVIWPRALSNRGRGQIWDKGKLKLAHRWVWERLQEPIPPGKILCHHCDNPSCVNIAHLYVGTQADNMRDMRERGRSFGATNPRGCREAGRKGGQMNNWSRGESNPRAKLMIAEAHDIALSNKPTRALAEYYGVHMTTIQRIRTGKMWANA